jgi:hypothetical protein
MLTAVSIAACDSAVPVFRGSDEISRITDAVVLSDGSFVAVGGAGLSPAVLSIDASGAIRGQTIYDDLRGTAESVAVFGGGLAILVGETVARAPYDDFDDPTLHLTTIDGTREDILFDATTFDDGAHAKLYSTHDGGLVVVSGIPYSDPPDILRFNAAGQLEWSYENPESMVDAVLLPDGRTVVQSLTTSSPKLRALDVDGVELWEKAAPGVNGPMATAGDGFVTIRHSGQDSTAVRRYDGHGTMISEDAVVIPKFSHITALTGFEDGGSAYACATHSGTRGVLVRLHPDGSEAWRALVDETTIGSLVALPDGRLFAVGTTPSGNTSDVFTAVYD